MFKVGDVIRFESVEAGKTKYHLCISLDGHYLFINSPKRVSYPGDFVVPSSELPFLPPTDSGNSIISCSIVMRKSDSDLKKMKAVKLGAVTLSLMQNLVAFVQASPVLTRLQKDIFLDAMGDWA